MKLKITVHGVAYEVDVEVLDAKRDEFGPTGALPQVSNGASPAPVHVPAAPAAGPAPAAPAPAAARPAMGSNGVTSPIAGTVVEIKCKPGDTVTQGQELLVIEAMKMNTSIASPEAGTIKSVPVAAGDSVRENQQLVEFA
jgi:glutaconyl-CoA/methylmalonyl-CoA decarboxylase subunit gamma